MTGTDRIVEIAIVTVNQAGQITDEWSTLVNPKRPIDWNGRKVHNINDSMVESAPTFATIAGDVVKRLEGAVVVAHNISYEDRLLDEEFRRLNIRGLRLPALCTWRLAKRVLAIDSHRLGRCCSYLNIPLLDAHTALADAYATAQLAPLLLAWESEPMRWETRQSGLPPLTPSGRSQTRSATIRRGVTPLVRSKPAAPKIVTATRAPTRQRSRQGAVDPARADANADRVWCQAGVSEATKQALRDHGYVVAAYLTASVKAAVCDNTSDRDVKVQKARSMGIPVLHTSDLSNLGLDVAGHQRRADVKPGSGTQGAGLAPTWPPRPTTPAATRPKSANGAPVLQPQARPLTATRVPANPKRTAPVPARPAAERRAPQQPDSVIPRASAPDTHIQATARPPGGPPMGSTRTNTPSPDPLRPRFPARSSQPSQMTSDRTPGSDADIRAISVPSPPALSPVSDTPRVDDTSPRLRAVLPQTTTTPPPEVGAPSEPLERGPRKAATAASPPAMVVPLPRPEARASVTKRAAATVPNDDEQPPLKPTAAPGAGAAVSTAEPNVAHAPPARPDLDEESARPAPRADSESALKRTRLRLSDIGAGQPNASAPPTQSPAPVLPPAVAPPTPVPTIPQPYTKTGSARLSTHTTLSLVLAILGFVCIIPAPLAFAYACWIRVRLRNQHERQSPRRLRAAAAISGTMTAIFLAAVIPSPALGIIVVFAVPIGLVALWLWLARDWDDSSISIGATYATPHTAGTIQPGWYRDPWREHPWRYWDGSEWTTHVAGEFG